MPKPTGPPGGADQRRRRGGGCISTLNITNVTLETVFAWELSQTLRNAVSVVANAIPVDNEDIKCHIVDLLTEAHDYARNQLRAIFALLGDQSELDRKRLKSIDYIRKRTWTSVTEPTYLEQIFHFKLASPFVTDQAVLEDRAQAQCGEFRALAKRTQDIITGLYAGRSTSGYWADETMVAKDVLQRARPCPMPTEGACSICFSDAHSTVFVATGCRCTTARMCVDCAISNFLNNPDGSTDAKGRCPMCRTPYMLHELRTVSASPHSAL